MVIITRLLVLMYVIVSKLKAQSIDIQEQQLAHPGIEKEIIFTIHHKIQDIFIPRTTVHIIRKPDGKQGLLFPEKNIISGNDIDMMKSKLKNNELYTIKIQSHIGNYSSSPIITSIPACELQKSGFKEDILVHFDNKQNIISVSYSSPSATIARDCDASKIIDKINFQTRLKIAEKVIAQSVPIQAIGIIPPMFKDMKLETSAVDESGNIQKPPQTFFQRYWFYGVFAIVYMIIGMISGAVKDKPTATANTASK